MTTPKLRFKEFGGEWEDKTISEIASYRRGSFPQPYGLPEWLDENGFPFVQVYDVADNMLLKDKTKIKISQLAANQSVLAKAGTLIITLQGSIGRVAKMQYDAYVDRTLLIFQSYAMPIDTDYFKYALYLLFNIEKEKADGGIIKTITKETLSKFNIGIPCLEEQTKIASFLSAVDEKISQLTQKHELLSQYKQGMMQKLFSQQLRFKADDGSEFGEWEEKKLSEICLKIKDGTHFSPKTFEVGEYKYLTSKNVKNGYLDFSNLEFVSADDHKKIYSSCDVKFGDVLLTKDGTIGQCCVNTLTEEFSLLSSVAFLRLKSEFNNYFLYHILLSDLGQKEINGVIAGQALKRITLTKINDFKFMFPCLEEQTKIANFLSAIDQTIEVVAQQIEQAKQWKKGLLQQMFV
ncbi:restriction endonuclease subunit S [Acinetobacter nosocomialis]